MSQYIIARGKNNLSKNCVLLTSLSHNSRYWNKNKLIKMFDDLDRLPGNNKIIALNKNHVDVNKWINKYKYIIPSHFIIDKLFIDTNIEVNNFIKQHIQIRYDIEETSTKQLEHAMESYLITKLIISKYNPDYALYYGKDGDMYFNLIEKYKSK